MKTKRFFCINFLLFFFANLFAFEWGGIITNETRVNSSIKSFSNTVFRQSNSITLWGSFPFTNQLKSKLVFQTSYRYFFDFNFKNQKNLLNIFDIDLLKYSTQIDFKRNSLNFDFGRFFVSDLSGRIFSQNCDGISLGLIFPAFEFNTYFGYTGLLNSLNVKMINKSKEIPVNQGYSITHSYIPLILTFSLPEFFLNQTLSLQTSLFFDTSNDKFNRFYGTVNLSGPFANSLVYSFIASVQTFDFKSISNFSSFNLKYFFSPKMAFDFFVEYASGNQLFFTPFVAVSSIQSFDSLTSPEYTQVLLSGVDFIMSLNSVYFDLNFKGVFLAQNSLQFDGINCKSNCKFNLMSDVQVGLLFCLYYDFLTKGENNNVYITLNGQISF